MLPSWWTVHIGIGDFIFYAVPFLLLGCHLTPPSVSTRILGMSRSTLRRAYFVLLTVTMLAATLLVGRVLSRTILVPPGWDFQALWLYGHVADSGENPYLPAPYHKLAGPGPFVQDFREEVLDVGAVYPPPSLLFFAAVGWLPLRVAIVPWMIVQTAAFIGMVLLLWKTFFPDRSKDGLALVFTLSLLLPGTIATFGHGQVNFLAVLCVIAAWRSRDRVVGGVYIVGAVVLKLMYGALCFYPVLRRRFRPLTGIILTGLGAILASVATFGVTVFNTYLSDNPVIHRMPSYYFSTYVNQSLLGASLRLFAYHTPAFGPPIWHPMYLASATLIGSLTVCAVVWLPHTPEGEDVAFTLLILAGMLIYPWTLSNYYVLLLVPMSFLWAHRSQEPTKLFWTVVILSSVYPITYYAKGLYSILATLMLWGITMILAWKVISTTSKIDFMLPGAISLGKDR